jgi:hypothetical protein
VDKAFRGLTTGRIECVCEAVGDPGGADFALFTHAQRVDELTRLQRERARLDAAEARLLHAMHADPLPNLDGSPAADKQWVREDVACALRIAPQTAAGRLHDATDLVTRLPGTLALLAAGEITRGHALRLIDATRPLGDAVAARVEKRVLARAPRQSLAQFAASVRRAVLAADPRGAQDRHRDAVERRRVVFSPQPDGIVELFAVLPADAAVAMAARVQAAADRIKTNDAAAGITRTADQRRADALAGLVTGTLTPGSLTPGSRARPATKVTVALSTLLGADEQPGELDGYRPIPATVARALAFDPTGTCRRLLTDQHRRLVDVTSNTYRPPAPIARLVRLQHQSCCYPGCRRHAVACELDHILAWPAGPTCPANLQPLCTRHHHLKHQAGWTPLKEPDGSTTWTSPSGHTYARPPDELPIDTTGRNAMAKVTRPDATNHVDDDPPPF